MLGHSSINTTQIYAHVSPVHLQKQFNEFHPMQQNISIEEKESHKQKNDKIGGHIMPRTSGDEELVVMSWWLPKSKRDRFKQTCDDRFWRYQGLVKQAGDSHKYPASARCRKDGFIAIHQAQNCRSQGLGICMPTAIRS